MGRASKIRLFVDAELGPGQAVELSPDQAHYLNAVMRRKPGDMLWLFNGRDGEWQAQITDARKKIVRVHCGTGAAAQVRAQASGPDLWLLFAPLKRARTDFVVEKAVEMGISRLWPVFTEYTNSERIREDRITAQMREAAEQCNRLDVPELTAPARLSDALADWPADRALIFADEAAAGPAALPRGKAAVLIGPEGGFSEAERDRIQALPQAVVLSLGPRILRADTAAIAALTAWQMAAGDWPR